jgi:hypothetical protein
MPSVGKAVQIDLRCEVDVAQAGLAHQFPHQPTVRRLQRPHESLLAHKARHAASRVLAFRSAWVCFILVGFVFTADGLAQDDKPASQAEPRGDPICVEYCALSWQRCEAKIDSSETSYCVFFAKIEFCMTDNQLCMLTCNDALH